MAPRTRRGFTLLELLVVLVLMGVAAALVIPVFLSATRTKQPHLDTLIPPARQAAARRGEVIYLHVAASGAWRMDGAASPATAPLAAGHIDPFPGLPLTLLVSPTGTCAFDLRSAAAARVIRLEPFTCTITSNS
ncbi:MAG TPA: prepilin-type N-terminal cleavage/methylation domain-containing protein [Gemmatimonadaceae bacterium]|jgi:prepilin-type N-terminal cleavage/methylation domain-containing protein|nr:prepilin-type N-terminal cleavage/methylation domain-containing protein [Gemmatimonadaceae bacterium]